MTKLTKPPPDNLGKRQQELNKKVNDAFARQELHDLKDDPDDSTVNKFFKIDLAVKCRNIDYIIDVLKEGVTLYAHRALKKCQWLYNNEFSDIINPDYLHENVFPVTSMRVKIMILKTVVMKIRKEDRVIAFFNYCMEKKMTDIALKCLLFTSEEFKLSLLSQNKPPYNNIISKKQRYIQFLIGKSFALLEAYMKLLTSNQDKAIRKFRYMYPVDNNRYIDLLEHYVQLKEGSLGFICVTKLDRKLCDDIMKKYKSRVLAKPTYYMHLIHEDILLRNLTVDDAKIFIIALLPQTADWFWDSWFLHQEAKKFLSFIPHEETYEFLKKIFNDKYPDSEFETHKIFYKQEYFVYMTPEEQNEWALNQVKSDRQVLGVGKDYLWYRFVYFDIAFEEIKNFVVVTKEADKRAEMLNTLILSVRSDRELERLFKHYNKRHVNEPHPQKQYFLDEVISHQNVFEFDDACWEAFYTLLLSTELYNKDSDRGLNFPQEYYKTVTLFYHILNKKEMPGELRTFLLDDYSPCINAYDNSSIYQLTVKLNDVQRQFVFNYLHTFFTDKINEYRNLPYTHSGASRARRYFSIVVKLMYLYNVYQETPPKEQKPQKKRKTRIVNTSLSDKQLIRELKKDINLLDGRLTELKCRLEKNSPIEISSLLKKIKIYFPQGTSESFLEMYEELVSKTSELQLEKTTVEACVKGIFELGNENRKVDLMKKYVPEKAKINYNEIDARKLLIQKAICRYASKSIPPVPLTDILAYMNGDYVRFCMHLFNIYIAALPITKSIQLVESLLDAPVSTQKHALRLAFKCFSPENLNSISKVIWEKTKNVSLRSVIYKALYERLIDKNESELYDMMISFTLDLHDDDEKVVFTLIEKDTLPGSFLGKYKKATWLAISQFKDREPNIGRKTNVIFGIRHNLPVMENEFVDSVINEHINSMFNEKQLHLTYSSYDIAKLYKEKWNLTAEVIFGYSADGQSEKYTELAKDIVKKCLEMWNETHSGKFIYQQCCWDFIDNLNVISLEYYTHSEYLIPVYEGVLDVITAASPLYEIYTKIWDIKMVIANRRAIKNHRDNFRNKEKAELVDDIALDFGKELGKLVFEYVNKNTYYRSFSEKMNDAIHRSVKEILTVIGEGEFNEKYQNNALIALTVGLVELEILETCLLALLLLPSEPSNDKYQNLLNKIQKFDHPEVQFAIYQKLHS